MSQKNLESYLAEQEAEYQKKSEKIEKRKKRFKKKFFIFGIIFAVLLICTFAMDLISKDSIYKELKDVQVSDVDAINKIASSKEAVGYPDLFDKFETGYLGNKSMNSLNYGLIAENKYGFTYVNENGAVVFNKDNTETIIANEAISQINIADRYIIFRGTDKKLYTCKHDGTEKTAIVNDKVGTVVLAGDNIYYVNYTKSNDLYKYSLKDKKSELVFEADIKNFAIVADSVLYVDYANNLMLQDLTASTPSWTNHNVAKFYFNGYVFVQNNDKIVKFNLNNHFPEEVANGIDEFLGVDEDNIYYTVKNKLYSQSLNDGKKKELPYSFDYYKGVYSTNGKIVSLGGVKE